MSNRQTNSSAAVEWIGAIVPSPAPVVEPGRTYQPEILIWMLPHGLVLGMALDEPGVHLANAAQHLLETIAAPKFASAPAPTRIRVASPELAAVLADASLADIEIVCAPTPEFNDIIESMRQHLGETRGPSYFAAKVGADALSSLFRAAAALFRSAPWKIVPDDISLLSLTVESLGIHDAVLSVVGQGGMNYGVLLFDDVDDFDAYAEVGAAIDRGEEPSPPPHMALNFERKADLPPSLHAEIKAHHWEVAGDSAYPWISVIDSNQHFRGPTANEVTLAEAIARALVHVLAEKTSLLAAWRDGEPMTRTISVTTYAGEMDVVVRVPYQDEEPVPDDVLGALAELGKDGDQLDDARRLQLEDALARRFLAAPESKGQSGFFWHRSMMDNAANYLGLTIASLDAADLRELIFEVFPRQVSVDAEQAGAIIADCRAWFAFLKREYGMVTADECLRVLGQGADKKLYAALADPRNYGMAKSMMMAGRDAGYDLSSKAGVEAWMRELSSKPLPPSVRLPSLGTPRTATARRPVHDSKAVRTKKDQRKAAKKARKKSR